ncbi:MAG: hypothetical protein QOH95_147 [Gaiellaceae bacterium]|nr:hypothetical protein [Gaiellaceae bacterium]
MKNGRVSVDRQLGVDLFNGTWRLIDSREDDSLLEHMAHASAYHWAVAPECAPENRARGEWLVSRVYALTGRPEAALVHARRCLDWCERHALADWDLAFAYEALARASKVGGKDADAARYLEHARSVKIAKDEDRELLETDLATIV